MNSKKYRISLTEDEVKLLISAAEDRIDNIAEEYQNRPVPDGEAVGVLDVMLSSRNLIRRLYRVLMVEG